MHSKDGQRGIVIDRGTNQRIPFVIWFDENTGEYEAIQAASNGVDMLMDDYGQPIKVRGRAVGKLELFPIDQAAAIINYRPPEKVVEKVQVAPSRIEGLEVYKKLYFDVWRYRGESKRVVSDRWDKFLNENDFLDCFVLARRNG